VKTQWDRYAETTLRFPDTGLTLDLRLPLPATTPVRLGELKLVTPFAVVTACNPLGVELDAASNRRLTAVLGSLVRERYPAAIRANGGSPDGRHEEEGWALPVPLPVAERLAAEFLQNALFWYDGARCFILPVLGTGPVLPLPAL